MNALVPITLFGWIPAVLVMFFILKPTRAVIAAFVLAWLFLPDAKFPAPTGLPDYNKMMATTLGTMLAIAIIDPSRFLAFRPKWFDLVALLWCSSSFFSSLSNGLGIYNGLSLTFGDLIIWGLPYFIGRLYFCRVESLRELAFGIVLGGLVYAPLCWFEIRMSPQLNYWVYGYYQSSFASTYRYGGWRPMIFMHHGLMVGAWMMGTALVATWLWMSGALKRWLRMPGWFIASFLCLTSVFCKATGATVLLFVGLGVLASVKWLKTPVVVLILTLLPIVYIGVRITDVLQTGPTVALAQRYFGADRADSLRIRLATEEIMTDKAMQRPVFGWDGWGRARVTNESNVDRSLVDGLWIITFGAKGLVGLGALLALFLGPVVLLARRVPVRHWCHPGIAPVAAIATLLPLFVLDSLLNAMPNPIFTLIAGGLVGFKLELPRRRVKKPRPVLEEEALII